MMHHKVGHICRIAMLGLALAAPAKAEVTWMDLLEAPDDVALNQQFVAERIEAGDVPAALSAVERLINLLPADIQLRLLRTELLVSLGNDTLAIGELEALAQLPMAAEQSARVDELRRVIDTRAQRWRTIVSTSFGLSGSDNANTYPSSGLLEFLPSGGTENSTSTYETFGVPKKPFAKQRQLQVSAWPRPTSLPIRIVTARPLARHTISRAAASMNI